MNAFIAVVVYLLGVAIMAVVLFPLIHISPTAFVLLHGGLSVALAILVVRLK